MASLDTVAKFLTQARVLLQDTDGTRYPDADLIEALNLALLNARLIRPDLFLDLDFEVPNYTASGNSTVAIEEMYRLAFLYFIVGHAQLRDEEDTQDARAAALLSKFTQQLRVGT